MKTWFKIIVMAFVLLSMRQISHAQIKDTLGSKQGSVDSIKTTNKRIYVERDSTVLKAKGKYINDRLVQFYDENNSLTKEVIAYFQHGDLVQLSSSQFASIYQPSPFVAIYHRKLRPDSGMPNITLYDVSGNIINEIDTRYYWSDIYVGNDKRIVLLGMDYVAYWVNLAEKFYISFYDSTGSVIKEGVKLTNNKYNDGCATGMIWNNDYFIIVQDHVLSKNKLYCYQISNGSLMWVKELPKKSRFNVSIFNMNDPDYNEGVFVPDYNNNTFQIKVKHNSEKILLKYDLNGKLLEKRKGW